MWCCEKCKFELVKDTDALCKACKAGLCAFVSKEDKKENLDINE